MLKHRQGIDVKENFDYVNQVKKKQSKAIHMVNKHFKLIFLRVQPST